METRRFGEAAASGQYLPSSRRCVIRDGAPRTNRASHAARRQHDPPRMREVVRRTLRVASGGVVEVVTIMNYYLV